MLQTTELKDGYLLAPADNTRCDASSSAWLVWTPSCFKPYAVLAHPARARKAMQIAMVDFICLIHVELLSEDDAAKGEFNRERGGKPLLTVEPSREPEKRIGAKWL